MWLPGVFFFWPRNRAFPPFPSNLKGGDPVRRSGWPALPRDRVKIFFSVPGEEASMRNLSTKEQAFVDEYLIDLCAAKAAVRAGYSVKTAKAIANQLMAKPHIAAAVADAVAKRAERTRIDADWLLRRLVDEADADIADLYDEHGNLKPVREWPKVWRTGLITGIDVEELFEGRGESREHIGRVRKVRYSDRNRVLELIGKHVGVQAFRERVEHTGAGGGPITYAKLSDADIEAKIAAYEQGKD